MTGNCKIGMAGVPDGKPPSHHKGSQQGPLRPCACSHQCCEQRYQVSNWAGGQLWPCGLGQSHNCCWRASTHSPCQVPAHRRSVSSSLKPRLLLQGQGTAEAYPPRAAATATMLGPFMKGACCSAASDTALNASSKDMAESDAAIPNNVCAAWASSVRLDDCCCFSCSTSAAYASSC